MSITIQHTCAPVQGVERNIVQPKPSRVWSVFSKIFSAAKVAGIMALGGCGVVFMAVGGKLFPPIGAAMLVCSAVSSFFFARHAWSSRSRRMDAQLDRHEALINRHDGVIVKHDVLVDRHDAALCKHDDLLIRHEAAAETLDGEICRLSKLVESIMELRIEMRNNLSESREAMKELTENTITIEQACALVATCANEMSRAMEVLSALPAMKRSPKVLEKPVYQFNKSAENNFEDDSISPPPQPCDDEHILTPQPYSVFDHMLSSAHNLLDPKS